MMIKKILKKILPEKLIWKIGKLFPTKPFLSDIAGTERIVEYAWVLQKLPEEGSILDVGCSGSMFAKMLASLGYNVVGADMRNIEMEHPNFTFYNGDASNVEGLFDVITCISTIEHTALIPGAEKRLLASLMRLLKPDGCIIITVPCGIPVILNGYKVFGVNDFHDSCYFKRVTKGIWMKAEKEEVANVMMKNKDEVKAISCTVIKKSYQ